MNEVGALIIVFHFNFHLSDEWPHTSKGISSPTLRVARIRSRVWAGLTPGKRVGTRIYNSTRRLLDGGFSGLLDFVLQALRALRPCDPYNAALDSEKSNKYFWFFSSEYFSWSFWNQRSGVEELCILVVGRTKTVNAKRGENWGNKILYFRDAKHRSSIQRRKLRDIICDNGRQKVGSLEKDNFNGGSSEICAYSQLEWWIVNVWFSTTLFVWSQ